MCIVRLKWESPWKSALSGINCTAFWYLLQSGHAMPMRPSTHWSPHKFHALVTIFGFPLSLFFPFLLDQINFWQMFGKSSYPVIHIYKSCCCSVVPILFLHWSQRIIWEIAMFPVMNLEALVFLAQFFELFRFLILENWKPSVVLHIDISDSWKVNRNSLTRPY